MKKTFLSLLLSVTLWGYGEGTVFWAPKPSDTGEKANAKHGGHGMGETNMFTAIGLEGNGSATLRGPDLSLISLPMEGDTLTLPKSSMGGYYALVFKQHTAEQINTAIRYLSMQGRPVKISPTRLIALPKADLEILPHPLHREHDRYTASKAYRFLITFRGKALSSAPIILETRNHSSLTSISDQNGIVEFTLPNDFHAVRIGKSDNKPSEFLIQTHYHDTEALYVTTFSMPYHPNPNDYWQSQRLGAGAIVLGFLGGLFIYRRTKSKGVKRG